jgi:hypothetical protein
MEQRFSREADSHLFQFIKSMEQRFSREADSHTSSHKIHQTSIVVFKTARCILYPELGKSIPHPPTVFL